MFSSFSPSKVPRALEIQAYFTSTFSNRSYPSMIGIPTTIKDNLGHTFFFRTLGNEFAYFARDSDLTVFRDCR
jgi:hypothetical protein